METVESRTESEIICSLGGRGGNVVPLLLLLHSRNTFMFPSPFFQELHAAMRRAGQNPTEAEVQDMINEVNHSLQIASLHVHLCVVPKRPLSLLNAQVDVDGSGYLEFPEFCLLMHKKLTDCDQENDLKEVFRVFGKDETGE